MTPESAAYATGGVMLVVALILAILYIAWLILPFAIFALNRRVGRMEKKLAELATTEQAQLHETRAWTRALDRAADRRRERAREKI